MTHTVVGNREKDQSFSVRQFRQSNCQIVDVRSNSHASQHRCTRYIITILVVDTAGVAMVAVQAYVVIG